MEDGDENDAERLAQYRQDVNDIVKRLRDKLPQLQRDEEAKAERQAEDVKQAARRWRNEMLSDETLRNPLRTPLSAITSNLDEMKREVKKLELGRPFDWRVDRIFSPDSVATGLPLSLPRPGALRLLVEDPVQKIVQAAEKRVDSALALAKRRIGKRASQLEQQAFRWQEKMLASEKQQLFLRSTSLVPQNMLAMRYNLTHIKLFGPMAWPVSEFFQQSIKKLPLLDSNRDTPASQTRVDALNFAPLPAPRSPPDFAAAYNATVDAIIQQAHAKIQRLVRDEIASLRRIAARFSGEAASWKVSMLSDSVQAILLNQHHAEIERRLQIFRVKTARLSLDAPFDWSITDITEPFIPDPHRTTTLSVESLRTQQAFLDRVRHVVSVIVDEVDTRLTQLCVRGEDQVKHTARVAVERADKWRDKMREPENVMRAQQRWTRTERNLQTLQASVQQLSLSRVFPWPVSDLLGRFLRLDGDGHLYGPHGAATAARDTFVPHAGRTDWFSQDQSGSHSGSSRNVNPYVPQAVAAYPRVGLPFAPSYYKPHGPSDPW